VRRGLQDAGQQEVLSSFDKKLDAALAEAAYSVSPRIRRAYGLTGDTSGAPQPPALPSGMRGRPAPPAPGGSPNN
jgi:hypothetical protein